MIKDLIEFIIGIAIGYIVIKFTTMDIVGYGIIMLVIVFQIYSIYTSVKARINKNQKGNIKLTKEKLTAIYDIIANNTEKLIEGESIGDFVLDNISSQGEESSKVEGAEKVLGFNKNIHPIRRELLFDGFMQLLFQISSNKDTSGNFNTILALNEISYYIDKRSDVDGKLNKVFGGLVGFATITLMIIFGLLFFYLFQIDMPGLMEGKIVEEGTFDGFFQLYNQKIVGIMIGIYVSILGYFILTYMKVKKGVVPLKKLDAMFVNFIVYSFIMNSFRAGRLQYFNFQQIVREAIGYLRKTNIIGNSTEEQVYNVYSKNIEDGYLFFDKIGNQSIGDNLNTYYQQSKIGEKHGYNSIATNLRDNYTIKGTAIKNEFKNAYDTFVLKTDAIFGSFFIANGIMLFGFVMYVGYVLATAPSP